MNASSVSFLIHFALGNNYKPQREDESSLEIKEERGFWLRDRLHFWSAFLLITDLWFSSSMRHVGKSHFSASMMVRFSHGTWLANETSAEGLGGIFDYWVLFGLFFCRAVCATGAKCAGMPSKRAEYRCCGKWPTRLQWICPIKNLIFIVLNHWRFNIAPYHSTTQPLPTDRYMFGCAYISKYTYKNLKKNKFTNQNNSK